MGLPIDRTNNLVLTEPFNLNATVPQSGSQTTTNPLQNPSLYPTSAQQSNIFGRLVQNDTTVPTIPGLTVTPPSRGANDPPGTLQSGTVRYEGDQTFRLNNGTGVRVNAGLNGSFLRDDDVLRNRFLGGGQTTGGGQVNLEAGATIGWGSLQTIEQPSNLQPAFGARATFRVEDVGRQPNYQAELRATVATERAAASLRLSGDSMGRRGINLEVPFSAGNATITPNGAFNVEPNGSTTAQYGVRLRAPLGRGLTGEASVLRTESSGQGRSTQFGASVNADLGNGITGQASLQHTVRSGGRRSETELRFGIHIPLQR